MALPSRTQIIWKRVANELGLKLHGDAIHGKIGVFRVTIEACSKSNGRIATNVTIEDCRLPHDLQLDLESFGSHIAEALGGEDIRTGDEGFDARVRVRGHAVRALAVLGHRARALVLDELERGTVVRGGRVRWERVGFVNDETELVTRTRALIDLTTALRIRELQVADRLAANARQDPEPAVQLRNLQALQGAFRRADIVLATDRELLRADAAQLRFAAALHLGGAEAFDEIAALATDERTDAGVRCAALEHLITEFCGGAPRPRRTGPKRRTPTRQHPLAGSPAARVPAAVSEARFVGVFEAALASPNPLVLRLGIRGLGALRHRPTMRRLLALLHGADPETSAAIVVALVRIGDAEATEPALLPLLASDSFDVRLAAIRALAEIGTVASVEPLVPLSKDALLDTTTRLAAREAVDRIQARLGSVDAGRLSLGEAAAQQGALSLSGEEGKLSLAESGNGPPAAQDAEGGSAG